MPDSSRSDAEASVTTDLDEIRRWAEKRGGKPAVVKPTHRREGSGLLRIEFPDYADAKDDNLEEISWQEFGEIFAKNKLAFLHQEHTASGAVSRFFKFVERA